MRNFPKKIFKVKPDQENFKVENLDLENFKKCSKSKVQMNQQVSNPVNYQLILSDRQIQ